MKASKTSDLITVIVPLYNHERYIQDTIRSLIVQTYENIELIVIDDGSNDFSRKRVRELESECKNKFENYVFIEKDNEGIVKTLNLGIAMARGDYLYIIASDDIAEPHALAVLHRFLSTHPDYGLAVGSNILIDSEGNRCYWDNNHNIVYTLDKAYASTVDGGYRRSRSDVDFYSDDFGEYGSLLRGNYIPNGYLLNKEVVDNIGGYSEKAPMEDHYLMLQMSKRKKFKFIDQKIFRYRWHSTNAIRTNAGMGEFRRRTILQERNYCIANGFFLLWLKQVYWSVIKYYWVRCMRVLVK